MSYLERNISEFVSGLIGGTVVGLFRGNDQDSLANKSGMTRFGYSALLAFATDPVMAFLSSETVAQKAEGNLGNTAEIYLGIPVGKAISRAYRGLK